MHLLVSSSHPFHLKNTLTKELHSRLCVQKQKAHWTTSYSHQVICIKVLFPFSDSSCLCQEGGGGEEGGGLECCADHSESLTCVLWSVSKFLNASLLCMQCVKGDRNRRPFRPKSPSSTYRRIIPTWWMITFYMILRDLFCGDISFWF